MKKYFLILATILSSYSSLANTADDLNINQKAYQENVISNASISVLPEKNQIILEITNLSNDVIFINMKEATVFDGDEDYKSLYNISIPNNRLLDDQTIIVKPKRKLKCAVALKKDLQIFQNDSVTELTNPEIMGIKPETDYTKVKKIIIPVYFKKYHENLKQFIFSF